MSAKKLDMAGKKRCVVLEITACEGYDEMRKSDRALYFDGIVKGGGPASYPREVVDPNDYPQIIKNGWGREATVVYYDDQDEIAEALRAAGFEIEVDDEDTYRKIELFDGICEALDTIDVRWCAFLYGGVYIVEDKTTL